MQILEPQPEIRSYSDETGHYIEGFLISTKPTSRMAGLDYKSSGPLYGLAPDQFQVSKETIHNKVQTFRNNHFAIIPELINKSPASGGGGHYWGSNLKDDLRQGYQKHSHGVITKVLGPYGYNDGTDDVYYNFVAKLKDSKAASVLLENGQRTWIHYAVSPHIVPIEGPENNITDWEGVGVALVDRGAYGPDAILTKMCNGTEASCDKALSKAGSLTLCQKEDAEMSQIITSLVSKAASFQHTMAENIPNAVTNAPVVPELKAEPTPQPQSAVNQISITAEEIQKIKDEAIAKSEAIWKEKVTALETKDKINTLNLVWAKVKDPTVKEALIKKYQTLENVDIVKEIADDVLKNLSTQEEEEKKDDKPAEEPKEAKKSKAASLELTKEPDIPTEDKKSKAASQQDNPAQLINSFIMGGKVK